MSTIPIDERRRLCDEFSLDPPYLYQLLTGRRELEPMKAVALEAQTGGRLRRWHLRAKTWHLVWPELIGVDGAPAVPTADGGEGVSHAPTVAPPAENRAASQTAGETI